jgi:translation initiation factor 4G
MEKVEEAKDIEAPVQESSDSEIEKGKPKREKKPYVLTEARKAQFEKARLKRQENLKAKRELEEAAKKQAEEKLHVYDEIKKDLQVKKEKKQRKQKAKEIKQIMQELSSEESEGSDCDAEHAEQALRALIAKKTKREKHYVPEHDKVPQEFPTKHGHVPAVPMRLPTSGIANLRFC